MRISDWSSDVCSSDLIQRRHRRRLVDLAGGFLGFLEQAGKAGATGRAGAAGAFGGSRLNAAGAIYQIGRASCRERVCQYVSISVVAESLKKNDCGDDSISSIPHDTQTQTHITL